MKNGKTKKKLRSVFKWVLWVLVVQFVLINISAALYAHKLTHINKNYPASATSSSENILEKTWRIFTGPKLYRQYIVDTPRFDHTTMHFYTKDSIAIEAWYSRTDSLPKGTVILLHGLMGNKGQMIYQAAEFRDLGYHVMLIDVRGHGNSDGEVITMGYRETEEIKLAYDYTKQQGEKDIFLWGSSMGAVEVIKAVSDYDLKPAGIIVEMPFLSLQSHLEGRAGLLGFPRQPFAFLTSFWIGVERGFNGWNFKTTRYAKNIHCPVLMQCGKMDKLVLQYETDAIYKAIASTDKKLVMYDNAGHTYLLQHDPGTWKGEVEGFLNRTSKIN